MYIDKTAFIRDWWETGDDVTLITGPWRYGKIFMLSMVESFFLGRYEDKAYKTQLLAKGIKQDMNKKLWFLHLKKKKL